MIEQQYEIEKLIPHKGKMLLVDKIISVDINTRSLTSQVTIKSTDIFFNTELQGVPSYVSFEYMAQTISALSAILNQHTSPKAGVILSVSNLQSTQSLFTADQQITIHVQENCVVGNLFTFDCTASLDNEQVVSCTLLVMETDSLDKLTSQRGELIYE